MRFRIGKGLYDPNAENNTRWLNKTVKAFDSVCEKIKNMKLKEGSRINLVGNVMLDVWTDEETKETKTNESIVITDIEYASTGTGSSEKNEQESKTDDKAKTQKKASNNSSSDNFEGYETFGGTNAFFSED